MPEDRFPYEQSTWSNNIETKAGWYTSLEQTGTESVKAQLLSHQGSSRSSISIGHSTGMVRGFAEQWLAWHERRKSERETEFRRQQIYWTRWAAVAARTAAAAAIIGWVLTLWRQW